MTALAFFASGVMISSVWKVKYHPIIKFLQLNEVVLIHEEFMPFLSLFCEKDQYLL